MRRFFSADSNCLTLSKDDVNHIANVLRLNRGDEILICDGKSTDYLCRISEITKSTVSFESLSSSPNPAEPSVSVTLFQGLPKSDKMDLIVQKCVELGVNCIIPVESERSVVKVKESANKKISRWQSISEAAAKQSGRGIVPEIGNVIDFGKALEQMGAYDISLIPYELETANSIDNTLKNTSDINSIAIFVGPEGGISEKEINLAKSSGLLAISLGRRILRCETAGFTALTLSLAAVGEY